MKKEQAGAASRALAIVVEDRAWRTEKTAQTLMREAIGLGLAGLPSVGQDKRQSQNAPQPSVTLLLTDDNRLRTLNRTFRGKDAATNVLSFPSAAVPYLGDIAIAHGVTAREADSQGKDFAAHAAHLALHGLLHLLGYDHERSPEARQMETLERKILARLGISDPYARLPGRH